MGGGNADEFEDEYSDSSAYDEYTESSSDYDDTDGEGSEAESATPSLIDDIDNYVTRGNGGGGKSSKRRTAKGGCHRKRAEDYGDSGDDDDGEASYQKPVRNAVSKLADGANSTVDFLATGTKKTLVSADRAATGIITGLTPGAGRSKPAPTTHESVGTLHGQTLHYDTKPGHTFEVHHPFNILVSPGGAMNATPHTTITRDQIKHAVNMAKLTSREKGGAFGLTRSKYSNRIILANIGCGKLRVHLVDQHTGQTIAELPYDVGMRFTAPSSGGAKADGAGHSELESHFNQHMHPGAHSMAMAGHSGHTLGAGTHHNSIAGLLHRPEIYADRYNAQREFENAISSRKSVFKDGADHQLGNLSKTSNFYKIVSAESGGGSAKSRSKREGGGKQKFRDWINAHRSAKTLHEDDEYVYNFPMALGNAICKHIQAAHDARNIKQGIDSDIRFEFHPLSRGSGKDAATWNQGISSKLLSQNRNAMIRIEGAACATFAIPQPATAHELSGTIVGDGA